jgi:hypothetical protein
MSEGATEIQPGAEGGGGGGETDWKAQVDALSADTEKWKGLARKNETDLRKAQKDLDAGRAAIQELEALKRAGQSESEKYASLESQFNAFREQHEPLAGQVQTLTTENTRLRAGLEAGLSLADMAFIPAGTEEEMKAAAKTLASRLGAARDPNFDGGARTTPSGPMTMDDVIRTGFKRDRRAGS